MLDITHQLRIPAPDVSNLSNGTLQYTSKIVGSIPMYFEEYKFHKFTQLFREIVLHFPPEKRKELLLHQVLPKLPDTYWDLENYKILEYVFKEELGSEIVSKMSKELEGKDKDIFLAYSMLLSKFASGCREYADLWKQVALQEIDMNRIRVESELSLTFDKINNICNRWKQHFVSQQRFPSKAINEIMPLLQRISLLFIRISQILYLLEIGDYSNLNKKLELLRTERYEVDFYRYA